LYNFLLPAQKQYHGGTNFDRSTGGPFIATSYDFDAPIDEYGTIPSTFVLKSIVHVVAITNTTLVIHRRR
jgi:hypothetical protein